MNTVKFTDDYDVIYSDGAEVYGDNCEVYGNNCMIFGNHCKVYGKNPICLGKGTKKIKTNMVKTNNLVKNIPFKKPEYQDEKTDVENDKCKICIENKAIIVFVPCGHNRTCYECSEKVIECPFCRKKIENKIKIFK